MVAPTLLRLIEPADLMPALPVPIPLIPARAGYEHLTSRERATTPAVATREALLQRLEVVGELSPEAPLSFLVVHVYGMGKVAEPDQANDALEAITRTVVNEIGPFDLAGRYTASSFGVVLQGRGARSTSALAARLQYMLNRINGIAPAIRIDVYAATGTGRNATTLPTAAGDSLPDIG